MNEHVTPWLEAYHDGELSGRRLRQVKSHLATCGACQIELERLQTLSSLLHESPAAAGLMPADRFVAQVGLRLPRRQERPVWQRALDAGWRLTPLGLLVTWVFAEAVFVVARLVLLALPMIPQGSGVAKLARSAARPGLLVGLLGLLGADLGTGWRTGAEWLSAASWSAGVHIFAFAAIGLLYWGWLASWWARRKRGLASAGQRLAS